MAKDRAYLVIASPTAVSRKHVRVTKMLSAQFK